MENLSLDPVEVKTDLATTYLKQFKNFEEWPTTGRFWHVKKYPDNKTEYITGDDRVEDLDDEITSNLPSACIARNLAKIIEEFEATFCQLEFLMRKTDLEDVKNSIKLITQHLQCSDISWNPAFITKLNILMNEKTPLYTLGYVASAIRHSSIKVNIVTTQQMAPICYLFTELCEKIGWTIPLIFVHAIEEYYDGDDNCDNDNSVDSDTIYDDSVKTLNIVVEDGACRCTGVVTESADIDSALDLFINSSVTAPWRFRRLYIQDSVYDEVKSALASRCTRKLVNSCTDAFATKGKIFLCDASSEDFESSEVCVPVEAYRTTKELCSLLAQDSTPCLSLWAADTQVAHEVALQSPASFVWINEYATFYGPPSASIPIYEVTYPRIPYVINEDSFNTLTNLSTAWKKLTKNQRIDLITNTVQKIHIDDYDNEFKYINQIQNVMLNWQNDSFASVDNSHSRICYSIEVPAKTDDNDITFINENDENNVVNMLIAAISGRAVAYSHLFYDNMDLKIFEALKKAGVPVTERKVNDPSKNVKVSLLNKKLKVISTNIATVFAN